MNSSFKTPHSVRFYGMRLIRPALLLVTLFIQFSTHSQNQLIFGNGTASGGSIYSLDTEEKELKSVTEFTHDRGSTLSSFLKVDGNYWSTITDGGAHDEGAIFQMDTNGQNYSVIYSFEGTNGSTPNGTLTQVGDRIWGTTKSGGNQNAGTIFSIHKNGTGYTVEHHFKSTSGWIPAGALLFYKDELWGVTSSGGAHGRGVIFSIDQFGIDYKVHHEFDETYDGNPHFGLTLFDNDLWGITRAEPGSEQYGIIYKIDPGSSGFSLIHQLTEADGYFPNAGLTSFDGKLWGTTFYGGNTNNGTIFTIENNGGSFAHKTVYHCLDNPNNPTYPSTKLEVVNDFLWGLSNGGGEKYEGTIYRINSVSEEVSIMYSFQSNNNLFTNFYAAPDQLLNDGGNLWGTKHEEVFKIETTNSFEYNVVHNFFNPNGGNPDFGYQKVGDRIWGIDAYGGSKNQGVIFSMYPDGSDRQVEYTFTPEEIFRPRGSLTPVGNEMFGITNGEIYAIDVNSSELRIIGNVESPKGTPVYNDGFVYALSENSSLGAGGLFSMNVSTGEVEDLFGFDIQVGFYQPNLTLHEGIIYGGYEYTDYSQPKFGGIFKYNIQNGEHSILYESERYSPSRGVTIVDDVMWGVAHDQTADADALFRINVDGTEFEVIHTIDDNIGDNVVGELTLVDQRLWGKVFRGGAFGVGSLFSFIPDPSGSDYDVKKETDLTLNLGGNPTGSLFATPALKFQELTADIPDIITLADIPFTLNVSSNSSNPVLYEVIAGTGTVADGAITTAETGKLSLKIYQEEDESYFSTAITKEITIKDQFNLDVLVTVPGDIDELDAVARLSSNGEVYKEKSINNGSVNFTAILEDQYYLQIIPKNDSEENYYATYYESSLTWDKASFIDLNQNLEVTVSMLENDGSQNTGAGTIGGTVSESEGEGARFLNKTEGPPISNLILYLLDASSGNIIDRAITDEKGQFSFNQISSGNYQMYVDVSGISVGKGRVIPFSESNEKLELFIGVGSDGITVENEAEPLQVNSIDTSITVYPNPTSGELWINNDSMEEFNFCIRGLTSSYISHGQISSQKTSLNIFHLENGIYLLQLTNSKRKKYIKFIKR